MFRCCFVGYKESRNIVKFVTQDISKAYGGRDLFRNFSLEVSSGIRLAVVGPNGAGKSTFLRILVGEEEPDGGSIIYPATARLGYMAQEVADEALSTYLMEWVMEAIPSWNEFWREWEAAVAAEDTRAQERLGRRQAELERLHGYNPESKAREMLGGLGFKVESFFQPLGDLSGGWRERAKLARALLGGGDILILDEPTNHLDLESVEWLERFLLGYGGTLVFVAHDRTFLDRVGTHVLFLGDGKPVFRKGSFSSYLQYQEEMEEQRQREAKKLSADYVRKMDFVRRFKAKASKARQAASKRKQALKIEKEMSGLAAPMARKTLSFSLPEPKRGEKTVCGVVDLGFTYQEGNTLWPPLNFHIYRGQKIALSGPNGCGKSTLLKLVAGTLQPTAGGVDKGTSIQVGYYSQHQLETLQQDNTVLGEVRRLSDSRLTDEELRSALGLFMLGSEYVDRLIRNLSGGEMSRVLLTTLFLARANFLILDEPANHLDLESREALIQALEEYSGTVLLVAHDRWLLNRVAEQVWALSDQGIEVHTEGFEEYERTVREAALLREREAPVSLGVRDREESKKLKREEAQRRNALYRELKPKREEYAALERNLDAHLHRQSELEQTLADPEIFSDSGRATELLESYKRGEREGEDLLDRLSCLEQEILELEGEGESMPGDSPA
jgi:ATP-binding cassette, subfamily F, member 3